MTEREMEELLWNYPERFFDEPLKKFRRQLTSRIGRSDLIFEDSATRLVIVEIKLGRLPRRAFFQLNEYQEAERTRNPERQLRPILVANIVPQEREAVCAREGIECRAISDKKFREVAAEVGFVFESETYPRSRPQLPSSKARARYVPEAKKQGGPQARRLKKFARAPAMACPKIPDAAWYGLSRRYREALAESTEASDNCHFAGFLVATGVGLGRAAYVKWPKLVYPNLFVAFLEHFEGGWVSEATQFVEQLIEKAAQSAGQVSSFDSREGLIQAVSRIQAKQTDRSFGALLLLSHYGRSLVDGHYKGGRKMMQFLAHLYECPRLLEVSTVKPMVVDPAPCVWLLTSCENLWPWTGRLKFREVERGIGDHLILVAGEAKRNPNPTEPPKRLWEPLVESLQQVFRFWHARGETELHLTDGARQLWSSFYSSLPERMTDDLFRFLAGRYGDSALKCGLILAGLDKSDVIAEQHMEAGIAFAEFLFESLRYVLGRPPISGVGAIESEIDQKIIARVTRAMPLGLSWREIRRGLSRIDRNVFEERRKFLLSGADPPLKVNRVGKRAWVVLNG